MANMVPGTNQEEVATPPKLISSATIGVSILMVFSFMMKQTYTESPVLLFGFSAIMVLFGVSHFIPKLGFGRSHASYLYAYHWLLAFGLIFVVPSLSYFLYLWVIFMYIAEFYYQARGAAISSVALMATMLTGSFYQNNGISGALAYRIVAEFTIIIGVHIIITRQAFGDRRRRVDMQGKILRAEFEHGRMIALINSMNDGVIATDESGKILNYNAAALDLIDTNDTLTGKVISDYLKVSDSKGEQQDIIKIAAETNYIQRRDDLSIDFTERDKIALDISISRIAKSTALSRQQGYMFLLRDITLQKSLDEERDLFISEVSHELRTPITIAEGEMSMAELLVDKPEVNMEDVKTSIGRAHDQVVFLAAMVNDLSTLSRAKRDDVDMDVDTFTVSEVLDELKGLYGPQADKKGLRLDIEVAPSTPSITTSRLYFREILQNLITNAIKYTSEGSVKVSGQPVDRDNIIISITDTGSGISKSEQAKVFEKFWRSEDVLTRSTGGTGLGLFITSKLADRIGAELKLESRLQEGSTFSLVLPVHAFKDVDQANVVQNEVVNIFN